MNLQSSVTNTTESPEARTGSETHLQGAWLTLARIAWLTISLLAIGLFVASLPPYFVNLHILNPSPYNPNSQISLSDLRALQRLGLSLDFYAWLDIGVNVIILFVYVLVGVVLFWRKSDDRMALLASLSLVLFPAAFSSQILGNLPPAWTLPTEIIAFLGNICIGLFLSVFPSGRFTPRWTRWLVVVMLAYWAINIFFPQLPFANFWLVAWIFPGLVVSVIVLQVYRYRRVYTPLQRQQTKWVIVGFAFAFGPLVITITLLFTVLPPFFPLSTLAFTLVQMPFDLLLLLLPLSIGFAVLRHRLWDIDLLIKRTLVYGILSVSLVLIYIGLIVGLQFLLQGVIGQGNALVIVASTLAIAALFQPLRHRIQVIIDRRFYRRKYDAARTLEAFSATLRNEVDLATLHEQLVAVVQETMQPTYISLWLRKPEQERTKILNSSRIDIPLSHHVE